MLSTPSWVSLRSSSRDSKSGPTSETVVRIGWPSTPNRSQKTTGNAANLYSSVKPMSAARLARKSFGVPASASPATSPFTSAQKTGTPAAEKPSEITWRLTVLPVPVAPVMRPCRLP